MLGKGGVIAATAKREADGATPIGVWPIRRVFYRPDREAAPLTALPVHALSADDGWCDAPEDGAYNKLVKRPYPARSEALWRDDHAYDLILELGYNDDPVTPGAGSAIFLHLAQPDWRATEGCVAVSRESMLAILAAAQPGDALMVIG